MMADRLTALLEWRPDDRETRLLQLFLGLAMGVWLYVAFDNRQSAAADYAAAQQRLATARTEINLLSNTQWRARIAAQKKLLAKSVIVDATPAIGEIRLRGEVLALASRAGLSGPEILGDASTEAVTGSGAKRGFSVLASTVEFDFDWAGLLRLLEEVEIADRGYLIGGFEVREEGDKRRMRVTFCALHKHQGGGA